MAAPVPYEFQRGETISVVLDCAEADRSLVTAVTAAMKPSLVDRFAINQAAAAIPFTVATTATGWLVTLSATASAALAKGLYFLDAYLTVAGGVEISPVARIKIQDSVTGG